MRAFFLLALLLVPSGLLTAQSRTLDIYWIDVEGGAATLTVSPVGGVDARRHRLRGRRPRREADPCGRASSRPQADRSPRDQPLPRRPRGRACRAVEDDPDRQTLRSRRRDRAGRTRNGSTASGPPPQGKRTIAKPGDAIPLQGVQAMVVSSDRQFLATPLDGWRAECALRQRGTEGAGRVSRTSGWSASC